MLKYTSLKEKDIEYLTFILRNGMVTAKQMMLKFQEPNIHRVYRRLRKLEGKNYVKHEMIAHKVGVYLGTIDARNLTNVSATVPTKASIYTMQHDLLLTDLVLYYEFQAMKQSIEFKYRTEREIRYSMIGQGDNQSKLKAYNANRDRIPDAVFFFKSADGKVTTTWVELELNKKERNRYDEKFKLLDAMLSSERSEDQPYAYDQVIYFADDVKIHNVINQAKQKFINANKISVRKIPSAILEERWEEVMPSESNGEKPGAISTN
ncbi:hypothetical protein COJ46_01600 [Bacillus sp. AFS077874]|uniref:hypothetical protein n=1 Tax=unclassified Bacillus (in: firmicutes) TaxID=185979 RepID=UPI000BED9EFD|nr:MULTISPECIES: hypothetical protein [unclassified Bacillus (in: firmicutes)]PEC50967.1 hypothetical protein CON00_04440 [Bacillus sp. AFS096315]PFM83241.1 hypothetical protein COJ46_01600 [Bacillus sp. AFS077874]